MGILLGEEDSVGCEDGSDDGSSVGEDDGWLDCSAEGCEDGMDDGISVGLENGCEEGSIDGLSVGAAVTRQSANQQTLPMSLPPS